MDIFKGSNIKKIVDNGHNKHPLHGKGAKWNKSDIQRLLQKMIFEEYLSEFVFSYNDIPSMYLKLGPKVNQLMSGSKYGMISIIHLKCMIETKQIIFSLNILFTVSFIQKMYDADDALLK